VAMQIDPAFGFVERSLDSIDFCDRRELDSLARAGERVSRWLDAVVEIGASFEPLNLSKRDSDIHVAKYALRSNFELQRLVYLHFPYCKSNKFPFIPYGDRTREAIGFESLVPNSVCRSEPVKKRTRFYSTLQSGELVDWEGCLKTDRLRGGAKFSTTVSTKYGPRMMMQNSMGNVGKPHSETCDSSMSRIRRQDVSGTSARLKSIDRKVSKILPELKALKVDSIVASTSEWVLFRVTRGNDVTASIQLVQVSIPDGVDIEKLLELKNLE